MSPVSLFFQHNIVFIYFLYGLSFWSLGLAVWLEATHASDPRFARAMHALAGFGFIHGVHEWIEMVQRFGQGDLPGWLTTPAADWARVAILAISYAFLVVFGIRLASAGRSERTQARFVCASVAALGLVWAVAVLVTVSWHRLDGPASIAAADVLARYSLAIPGSLVAMWALWLTYRAPRPEQRVRPPRDLVWTAAALAAYGMVGQLFTRRSVVFPSTILNSDNFLQWFDIPIQLYRALTAAVISVLVIRILRGFEQERSRHAAAAHEAHLQAQREALEAQEAMRLSTQALNRELQAAVCDLAALLDVSREMGGNLQPHVLIRRVIVDIVRSLPRFQSAAIWIGRSARTMAAARGEGEPDAAWLQAARELSTAAMQQGRALAGHPQPPIPVPAGNIASGVEQVGDAQILVLPLALQGEIVGCLALGRDPAGPPFTARCLSVAYILSGQICMGIENVRLYRELAERDEVRGELLRQAVSAQEAERRRVARELHDGTGQTLTALGLGLAAAAETVNADPSRAARHIQELKAICTQGLRELHEMIADFRPSVLYELGLIPALRGQIEEFQARSGIRVEFSVRGRRRAIRSEFEMALYRIVQEALTNVARHSGARAVRIVVTFGADLIEIAIADDGRGFDAREALQPGKDFRTWGLIGMQERVALIGGKLAIDSDIGLGTRIVVSVPLADEDVHHDEDSGCPGR